MRVAVTICVDWNYILFLVRYARDHIFVYLCRIISSKIGAYMSYDYTY